MRLSSKEFKMKKSFVAAISALIFCLVLALAAVLSLFFFSGHHGEAWAQSTKALCPDKVLGIEKIEGIFMGVQCDEGYCFATVKLDGGKDVHFTCGEEEAEKYFGAEGNKVSVDYELRQDWSDESESCQRFQRVKSGRILAKGAGLDTNRPEEARNKKEQETGAAKGKTFTNSIGMEFVLIPAGKFTQTWTAGKNEFGEDVKKQRGVTISKPFYLGKHEVTQEQWVAVMGENPAYFKGRTNPVEQVSWLDVQKFIKKLNEKEGGNKYRLPTEAEWEHAARAGTDTEWFFGKDPSDLGKYAWVRENCQKTTHPVGEKKPNPWGLYDIYGNVKEWVQDWYEEDYKEGAVTDPTGPAFGQFRVVRGGSVIDDAKVCRSAKREWAPPNVNVEILIDQGFRLAFSPGQ